MGLDKLQELINDKKIGFSIEKNYEGFFAAKVVGVGVYAYYEHNFPTMGHAVDWIVKIYNEKKEK